MAGSVVVKRPAAAVAAPVPGEFWSLQPRAGGKATRHHYDQLVARVTRASSVDLYHALEAGVPTRLVSVIAQATGQDASEVMRMIGVSATTFRRKDESKEPLPDVAGHRVMGFLRVAATLRRLLEESGDARQLEAFDLEAWMAQWMREKLPELGGKTPAEMLRNPEGLRAVEQVLERMRGGLPA